MTENNIPTPPFPPQELSPPGKEAEMNPKPRFKGASYQPAGKLKGRCALITGGDSGIGRAVAVLFAREGADVAIVHLPEEQEDAEETGRQVRSNNRRFLSIAGDVKDPEFCVDAVERTVRELGGLQILVNNAAYQNHIDFDDLTLEQWHRTFQTNIHGYFHMVKAAVGFLGEGGTIINTGSIVGLEGSGRLIDYGATKGAIHGFTKSLSKALFKKGIRVNCVAPGPVWTPLNPAERSDDEMRGFGEGVPAGRPAQPEEVAPAYVFLASHADSGFISGEVIRVLGGGTTAG